jgi:hypothetical protein
MVEDAQNKLIDLALLMGIGQLFFDIAGQGSYGIHECTILSCHKSGCFTIKISIILATQTG